MGGGDMCKTQDRLLARMAIWEAQADCDAWLCSIQRSFEALYFIFIVGYWVLRSLIHPREPAKASLSTVPASCQVTNEGGGLWVHPNKTQQKAEKDSELSPFLLFQGSNLFCTEGLMSHEQEWEQVAHCVTGRDTTGRPLCSVAGSVFRAFPSKDQKQHEQRKRSS